MYIYKYIYCAVEEKYIKPKMHNKNNTPYSLTKKKTFPMKLN
jgi:hypothetical protein